jgi:hypothetical protein
MAAEVARVVVGDPAAAVRETGRLPDRDEVLEDLRVVLTLPSSPYSCLRT